jgi:membrane protease YdiL (CAAX protease family)
VRAGVLCGFILLVEYSRTLVAAVPHLAVPALLTGGAALAITTWGWPAEKLGLGRSRFGLRLLGGLALAVVLILPAAAREGAVPILPGALAAAAVAVSVGEELAFRGALFAALEEVGGGPFAVVGTTAAWTAAHALSHPPAFLAAVAAAGLLLGLWRLLCKDLVAPIIGHVVADLAL